MCGSTNSRTQSRPAVTSKVDEQAAARRAIAAKQDAVINALGDESVAARRNKKGAATVQAFDALQNLVIQRQDGDIEDVLETIDSYVASFKV